jgi:hypothetical protein
MTSKKQKERKKKNREEISRQRVLNRRDSLRKDRKFAHDEQKKQLDAENAIYGKQKPFIKNVGIVKEITDEEKKNKMNEINQKLQRNIEILKALEEEYDHQQSQRREMNQKLENEGFKTMKEKMNALHQKALEIEGKAEELAGAQKEYDEQQEKNENLE